MLKKVVMGNDHAAVDMKYKLREYVESLGYEVINVGINETARCDYPDFAYKACKKIVNNEASLGILICGTGIGMSIAANKIKGIRACACSEPYSARMSREHNDANVLCLGERVIGFETAKEIAKAFLQAEYQSGHHKDRVAKIMAIQDGTYKE